jgi:malonyl-CoA/methylmalonyl-CoA synthetase
LVLYTSGTTSQPKGAVLTHAALQAQVESLVEAWGWRADDRLLHVLPLNHTHGLVNALLCPLWSGAVSELAPGFDAAAVWARLASGEITVFMAVPTMYQRLIAAWEAAGPADRRGWADGARALRLTVSGSAALPVPVFERWRQISGQALLERYGMTEIGMALSNPLSGDRRPGTVGVPLPGVEVRVVAEDGGEAADGEPGEIVVRSPGAFREYWDRPAETAAAWLADGWFSTGDVAVRTDGVVRILGRRSVDIIKTGGEKVSALEIEDVLRTHPAVQDCAVVGLPDEEWGECVTAAVVPQAGAALALDDLRDWARARLAPAKLPRRLVVVADLPRSPLGKVSKPTLVRMLAGPPASA